jgi:hypothetical protein
MTPQKAPKNTICLWFDKDAHDAARFHAATFPSRQLTMAYPGSPLYREALSLGWQLPENLAMTTHRLERRFAAA